MNKSNEKVEWLLGRRLLELIALREVCACKYYDLNDCLQETSEEELIEIIQNRHYCPICKTVRKAGK
jgi:hypothetical protein